MYVIKVLPLDQISYILSYSKQAIFCKKVDKNTRFKAYLSDQIIIKIRSKYTCNFGKKHYNKNIPVDTPAKS